MRREVRRPVSRVHGDFHQLVSVQAALHHGLGISAAAHAHADFGGLDFAVGIEDRIRRDVDADFCGESMHLRFIADQRGLDEALDGGFNCSAQRNVREGPADCSGDGRQRFAAIEKLVKDVIVGGMANQGIDDNGFGQGGEIAHDVHSPWPEREWAPSA